MDAPAPRRSASAQFLAVVEDARTASRGLNGAEPRARCKKRQRVAADRSSGPLSGRHIIVAAGDDDDSDATRRLRTSLTRAGATIVDPQTCTTLLSTRHRTQPLLVVAPSADSAAHALALAAGLPCVLASPLLVSSPAERWRHLHGGGDPAFVLEGQRVELVGTRPFVSRWARVVREAGGKVTQRLLLSDATASLTALSSAATERGGGGGDDVEGNAINANEGQQRRLGQMDESDRSAQESNDGAQQQQGERRINKSAAYRADYDRVRVDVVVSQTDAWTPNRLVERACQRYALPLVTVEWLRACLAQRHWIDPHDESYRASRDE